MDKKNILIFFDHDFIIRNFLYTNSLKQIDKTHNVKYVFPSSQTKRFSKIPNTENIEYLSTEIDIKRDYLIKRMYHLISIKDLSKREIKDKKIMSFFFKKALKKFFYVDSILAAPFIYKISLFIYKLIIGYNKKLEKLIINNSTDLIIHPTVLNGHFAYDLVNICKKIKLPCYFLMNSWDNPSTKPFSGNMPTKYFVWGKQSYNHSIKYLNMNYKNIVVSGAAQFEIYRDIKINSSFTKNYKKPICFAGSSKGLDEISILEFLDNSKNISRDIIYKPHPWKDFTKNEKNFNSINFKKTSMYHKIKEEYESYFSNRKFDFNKSNIFNNKFLFKEISILICPISTILLEAILNNIPVILYDPIIDSEEFSHQFIARTRIQYTEMFENLKPITANNMNELDNKINALLKNKNTYLSYINKLKSRINFFINFEDKSYSEKILDNIKTL